MTSLQERIETVTQVGLTPPVPQFSAPQMPDPYTQVYAAIIAAAASWILMMQNFRLIPKLTLEPVTKTERRSQFLLEIERDISVDEWQKAVSYTGSESHELAKKMLSDYELEPSPANEHWLTKTFEELILSYETEHGVSLTDSQRRMLSILAMRMAYDRLSLPKGD